MNPPKLPTADALARLDKVHPGTAARLIDAHIGALQTFNQIQRDAAAGRLSDDAKTWTYRYASVFSGMVLGILSLGSSRSRSTVA